MIDFISIKIGSKIKTSLQKVTAKNAFLYTMWVPVTPTELKYVGPQSKTKFNNDDKLDYLQNLQI